MNSASENDDLANGADSCPADAGGQTQETDDPRFIFLRQWIGENEPALYAALRPIGGTLADVRGLTPADATSDLLVEVTRIALVQAYPRYDLAYSSPRLWLLKIAHYVGLRWKEQAAIAAKRRADPAQYAGGGKEPWDDAPRPREGQAGQRSADPARLAVGNVWLRQRLSLLSPQDRAIVESQVVDDLSFAETGTRVGLTEGAARVRFHRIARRLEQQEKDDMNAPALREANAAGPGRRNGGANE